MERDSFVFYRSFYDCIKDLDDKQTRELVVAICERALNWNEIETDDKIVRMAYNLIKPQIDANTKRYVDWCKWWDYWVMWWRPKSTWDNSQKPQWGKKNNPSGSELKTPNVNDNDNVNENVNENENDINTLTANAVRWDIEKKVAVAKKNKWDVDGKALSKQDAINRLRQRMVDEWYSDTVVNLIMDFDEVKKWTKLHKQTDKWVKAFITTLNTRDTEQWKINVLNSAIAGPYQWIRPNRYSKSTNTRPVVSWNMFH